MTHGEPRRRAGTTLRRGANTIECVIVGSILALLAVLGWQLFAR